MLSLLSDWISSRSRSLNKVSRKFENKENKLLSVSPTVKFTYKKSSKDKKCHLKETVFQIHKPLL